MAALRCRSGHYIFALWFLLLLSIFHLFPRLFSAVADWMLSYFHTRCGLSANLGGGPKRAACGPLKIQDAKKSRKIRHLGTIAQLCPVISSQIRHASTIGKKLVKQQYLPHMSSKYGELRYRFVSLGHAS